ncbi:MAG: hypothetical protein GY748_20870 [Planctomycetaceae bacterium]|nr:hypothetical protein [Planctomycetaceae bacterium]
MLEQVTFWIIQGPGWALFTYLVVAQCVAAFSYDLGVRMGTQEPSNQVTQVGVALFWGFAFADLIFYTPLLGVGLVAHWIGTNWAVAALAAALGTTIYWPVTCLATIWKARGAEGWNLPKESQYWVVLPIIAGWATIALILVAAGF